MKLTTKSSTQRKLHKALALPEATVRLVLTQELQVGDRVMYPLPNLRITGHITRVWPSIEMKVEYALRPSGTPVLHKCGGRRTLPESGQCVLLSR